MDLKEFFLDLLLIIVSIMFFAVIIYAFFLFLSMQVGG